jgi:aspartyl aminopeptidase
MANKAKEGQLNKNLMRFLQASPTPFHAVHELKKRLRDAGFLQLQERESWTLAKGERYFVSRNDSSIIAFVLGEAPIGEAGIRMVGAHTDSPCLRVKPRPDLVKFGYLQLGVEVYGGVLLNPWFDRDLSLAGRITYRSEENRISNRLINFTDAVAIIPSLAIHLDRDVNAKRSINAQKHIPPIVMQTEDGDDSFMDLLLRQFRNEHKDADIAEILNYEISLYPIEAPGLIGFKKEFIAGARLDNLLSCFAGMCALLEAPTSVTSLLICNDHEEVGSATAAGAHGPFLKSTLQRVCPDSDELHRCIASSMLFSVDNAHGIHPNFGDKHDANHGPILNQGPVIKVNANQRYASNSETSGFFQLLCQQAQIPFQSFVTRSDMACGSTIGPITATETGVRTLDIGVPTFAMHSLRETCGSGDPHFLYRILKEFYRHEGPLGATD